MIRKLRSILVLALTTALIAALLAWSFHGVADRKSYVCGKCDRVYAPEKGDPDRGIPAGTPFRTLPGDWVCPSCGAGKSAYVPVSLWQAFLEAQWGIAPLAFLMGLLVFPVKALRWQLLLAPVKKIKVSRLLSAIMIGFMVNCILSRLGEVVRAAALGVKGETRTATALASIALERIFDLVSVVLILTVSLLWLHPSASGAGASQLANLRAAGAVVAVLFAAGVAFLVLLRTRPTQTTRFALACAAWLPRQLREKVEGFLKSFLKGLDTIQSAQQVVVVFALSLVHWLFQVLYFYLMAFCFPALGLSFPGAMLVFSLVALSVAAVPLPGYLGIFQGGVKAAALILALPVVAINYAWLCWALNVPPIILIGFGFLWKEGLTLGELRGRPR